MKIKLTKEQFKSFFPKCKDPGQWVKELNEILNKNDINTINRVSAFLAQTGHESGSYTVFSENLNYSEKGLNAVFGKYFRTRKVSDYARKPSKIANVVYANRMGNGDESTGDGWKYRGKGLIQLTGKNNYTNFSKDTNIDAVNNPELLLEKDNCILSAVWYWNKNKLNRYADSGNIKSLTKKINGGYNGLEDRIHKYELIKNTLSNKTSVKSEVKYNGIIKIGSKGEDVKLIQRKLNLTPDGDFGPNTEKHVRLWQLKNGLIADGIIGKKTFSKLTK